MATVKAKGDKGIAKAKAEGHVGKELNKELEKGSLPRVRTIICDFKKNLTLR